MSYGFNLSKKTYIIFCLILSAVFGVIGYDQTYAAVETRVQVYSDGTSKALWIPLDSYPKDYSNWPDRNGFGGCSQQKTLPWTMTYRGGQKYPSGINAKVGRVFNFDGDCRNPMTDGGTNRTDPANGVTEPGAWLYPRNWGGWARSYDVAADWPNAIAGAPCLTEAACGNRNYSAILDAKTGADYFGKAKVIVASGNTLQDNRDKSFMFTRNNRPKPSYCLFSNGTMLVGQKFVISEDDYEAAMKPNSKVNLNFGADDYVIAYVNGYKVAATQYTADLEFAPINKKILKKAPEVNYVAFQVNDHITGDSSGGCVSKNLKMALLFSLSIKGEFKDWKVTGTSAVSQPTVKRSDLPKTVTFSHKLTNESGIPAIGVNWYTEWRSNVGAKVRSGISNINSKQTITPSNSSYPHLIPASTPSGTQICQRIVFDSNPAKKKGYSPWACVVISDSGDDGDVEYWTKYDGDNPIPPGEEITKYEHFLTDQTYKIYDGANDGGRWYTADGYKQGDFFDHVDQHFKQDENEGEMLVSGSLNNREKTYSSPPNRSSINGSYWPKESDIGKTFCQWFSYDMWVKNYVIRSESRIHHYETWYDSDGNAHSYPVYAPWYWLEIQPARKVYTNTTEKDCVEVGKKPKVQVWGGDVNVGGSVQTSLMQPHYRELPLSDDKKKYGSWAEYGILLKQGTIVTDNQKNGTASASQLNGDDLDVNSRWWKLVFANDPGRGNFMSNRQDDGETGIDTSIKTFYDQFNNLEATGSSFNGLGDSDGVFEGITAVGGDVGAGKSIILKGDTINITSNIVYPSSYKTVADIPQVVIVANNINIAGNVDRVDAWLLASNSINTCSDVAPKAKLNLDTCKNRLIINGPVVTDKIYLGRTFGSTEGTSEQPAEIFNYRADASIWSRKFATGTGKITTVHVSEAAPRF